MQGVIVLDEEGLGIIPLIAAGIALAATAGSMAISHVMQKKAEKQAKKLEKQADARWKADQERIMAQVDQAERDAAEAEVGRGVVASTVGSGVTGEGTSGRTLALIGGGALLLYALSRRSAS